VSAVYRGEDVRPTWAEATRGREMLWAFKSLVCFSSAIKTNADAKERNDVQVFILVAITSKIRRVFAKITLKVNFFFSFYFDCLELWFIYLNFLWSKVEGEEIENEIEKDQKVDNWLEWPQNGRWRGFVNS